MSEPAQRSRFPRKLMRWLRRQFSYESPNHRVALMIGGAMALVAWERIFTLYQAQWSTLIPRMPWLGLLLLWLAAGILDSWITRAIWKLLDKIRPEGRHWPSDQE